MFQIKLMDGGKFNISKEEVNLLSGKTGLIFIPSLNGLINISSISSILPVELTLDRKQNKDGQWCIRKFGQWYLESNPEVRVNLQYYPELEEIQDKKQLESSKFAKELKDKF